MFSAAQEPQRPPQGSVAGAVSTRTAPRLDGIDVLRGLAILAVVLLHIWIRFIIFGSTNPGHSWPRELASLVWHNGGNGVTVFFAVSGFLITWTSLRRFGSLGKLRPGVFYRIRFARIAPLLLLLLAVLSMLHLLHVPDYRINPKLFSLPRALFSALTFHLNWLETSRNGWLPPCWTVLWSLSIEEMFYLFFPLLCVLLMSRGRSGVWAWFALGLALVIMGPFARTIWSHTELAQENSYLAGMSDIAVGCMAAWLTEAVRRSGRVPSARSLLWMQAVGWLPVLWFATWPRWHWLRPAGRLLGRSGTDDTLLCLGVGLIAASVALRQRPGRAWSAPVRWFGRHSYEIYLSHEFAVLAGVEYVQRRYPAAAPGSAVAAVVFVVLAASAAMGWALAKFFSEPLNRKLRGAPLPTELRSPAS